MLSGRWRIGALGAAARRAIGMVLLAAACALGAGPQFPPLTGRVVDQAAILSPATQRQLDAMLAAHERQTSEQVVVVTLKSLQGLSIEEFGYQLGRSWGIGQKGTSNGVLLILAPSEHKIRIEVGYGLEGKLTDAESRVIIDRDILPAFRRGDFNAGVLAGAGSILRVLGGESIAGSDNGVPWAQGKGPSNQVKPAAAVLLAFVVPLLLIFIFERRFARSQRGLRYGTRRSTRPVPFFLPPPGRGGWGGGGFGGGGSGGGGFSGGGGSFGGGGASGSW